MGRPGHRGKERVARDASRPVPETELECGSSKGEGWSKEIGEAQARKQAEAPYKRKMCGEICSSVEWAVGVRIESVCYICFDKSLDSYTSISPPTDHGGSRRNAFDEVNTCRFESQSVQWLF